MAVKPIPIPIRPTVDQARAVVMMARRESRLALLRQAEVVERGTGEKKIVIVRG